MNFLDKLDYLMERDHLNKHTLSQLSGVPYSTIVSFYKKGYENTKMSTAIKLASCFNVSLDYLLKDNISDENYGKVKIDLAELETDVHWKTIVDCYRKINKTGRIRLAEEAEILRDSGRYDKHSNIPLAVNEKIPQR